MQQEQKKYKIIGLCVTLVVHALLILLLVFLGFSRQPQQEESGILVMLGETEESMGNDMVIGETSDFEDAAQETEPEPAEMPETSISEPEPAPEPQSEPALITQNTEKAPVLEPEKKEADKQKAEELKRKKEEELRKQQAEEEARRKAAEEARLKAEAEAKRKAEEEAKRKAAQNLIAGAFGSNSGTGNKANGAQGSANGNNTTGANSGNAGYGEYDLGGRGIIGSLPRPVFNVNASGKVVVRITVDAQGNVIAAEPTTGTTTANQALRTAAVDAARKARFSIQENAGNVTGRITYYFDSNN